MKIRRVTSAYKNRFASPSLPPPSPGTLYRNSIRDAVACDAVYCCDNPVASPAAANHGGIYTRDVLT